MNKVLMLLCFGALLSLGCSRLSICQQMVDRTYLASTQVGTPDPRQAHPPFGQQLIVEWWLPKSILSRGAVLKVDIIYWNYTHETINIPLNSRIGHHQIFLIDKDFEEKKGYLTYMAVVETSDGEVFKEWKHQLWVNLITIDGDETEEFGAKNIPLLNPEQDQEPEFDYEEDEEIDVEPSPEMTLRM